MTSFWLSLALAQSPGPTGEMLAEVDTVLAAHDGLRGARTDEGFCAPSEVPGRDQRGPFCDGTRPLGTWDLVARHEGDDLRAVLTARTAVSAEARARSVTTIVERYGAGKVGIREGAFAWCYAAVGWQGDVLWAVEYGCHISERVRFVHAIEALVVSRGDRLTGEATAALGRHSGWAYLVDARGRPVGDQARNQSVEK